MDAIAIVVTNANFATRPIDINLPHFFLDLDLEPKFGGRELSYIQK
jgi:hypothetical protein